MQTAATATSASARALAELIASYGDVLSRGLRLPPVGKLMVWIAIDEACEATVSLLSL